MATEKVEATIWTCDGCGKSVTLVDDIPDGFHGSAWEAGSWGGGPESKWYACREACIRSAVKNAIESTRGQ